MSIIWKKKLLPFWNKFIPRNISIHYRKTSSSFFFYSFAGIEALKGSLLETESEGLQEEDFHKHHNHKYNIDDIFSKPIDEPFFKKGKKKKDTTRKKKEEN